MKAPWWEAEARVIREIVGRYPEPRSALMPLLHLAQGERGYLAQEDLEAVARILGLSKGYVESVCSFYSLYRRRPTGKYLLLVCGNIMCGLAGAQELVRHLERRLGIRAGETTPDGLFTLEVYNECVAACDGAPVLQVNLEYCLRVTPERADEILAALRAGVEPGALADRYGVPPRLERG